MRLVVFGLVTAATLCVSLPSTALPGFVPDRVQFTPLTAPSTPVQFGQVFFTGLYDPSLLVGNRGMVWSTTVGSKAVPGVYSLRYTASYRLLFDPTVASGKACVGTVCAVWLYTNHPDWIMYLNDRKTIAYEFSNTKYPPVDTGNPTVQALLLAQDIANAVPGGYRGIALDNNSTRNSFLVAGHYRGTVSPCALANRPACGGVWVQEFAGSRQFDPAWQKMNLDYLTYLRRGLARTGLTIFTNLSYQPGPAHTAASLAVNGSMAEGWTQHGCTTHPNQTLNGFAINALWQSVYQDAISDSKRWWFGLNYLCGHDTEEMTQAEESWGVANYLLASQNPPQNYLAMIASGSALYDIYPPSANPPIGFAVQNPPVPSSCGGTGIGKDKGVCMRNYSNGFVAVNSSGETALSFNVPDGQWVDQFCKPIAAGGLTLKPATAVVVVHYPNAQCP